MGMSDAERQRRKRIRQRNGRMVIRDLEVDEVNHVEMLIAGGFLPASACEDRKAIADATAQLLERLRLVSLKA